MGCVYIRIVYRMYITYIYTICILTEGIVLFCRCARDVCGHDVSKWCFLIHSFIYTTRLYKNISIYIQIYMDKNGRYNTYVESKKVYFAMFPVAIFSPIPFGGIIIVLSTYIIYIIVLNKYLYIPHLIVKVVQQMLYKKLKTYILFSAAEGINQLS